MIITMVWQPHKPVTSCAVESPIAACSIVQLRCLPSLNAYLMSTLLLLAVQSDRHDEIAQEWWAELGVFSWPAQTRQFVRQLPTHK